ncbi:hypothetical protein EJ03DRAFT_266561 [Teratosphaeria nubilosa]|uniref:CwfJ domain-containing protein n=1 Tax=Teratosphaeria nubilosa TaxID=161662 RepID=A0A6G1LI87_9PEZI|nr:hypothetical protein EJ03DRAFT_266561 [Teratosphaeria nubilosa]
MTDADPPLFSSFVIGDLNGKLSEVFTKVAKLHEKQQFAFGIIAGDLFGPDPDETEVDKILSGDINVPVPIYFALGKHPFPNKVQAKLEANDGELCPNLTCFGRRGVVKTTEGFNVASIGGVHDGSKDQPTSQYSGSYTDADVASLATSQSETGVDLLITSDWPQSITDGSKVAYSGEQKPQGVESLSNLCTAVKPRYHFSTSENYHEREPYFHAGPPPRSVTRFISIAPYGNPTKQKWIYAFSLDTSNEPPKTLEGCTASPFTVTKKRKLDSDPSNSGDNFRYANNNNSYQDRTHDRGPRGRTKRQRGPPPTPQECYFCLSRKDAQVHLLVSIATNTYLTIAKGPLTTPQTFSAHNLPIPTHILIIPIAHKPTLPSIPDADDRASTETEMQQYRAALHKMLAARTADRATDSRLGAVTFALSQTSGIHLHWQFLPLPSDLITRGLLTAAFETEAQNLHYPPFLHKFKEMQDVEESGDFFKVMIWSETYRKEMVLPLGGSGSGSGEWRFDLQFGRRVVGKLLGLEERVHWRDCPQSVAEEAAEAEATKELFGGFDPFR